MVSLRHTTRPLEPVVVGLRSLGQGWAGHPSHSRRLLGLRSFARVPAHRRIDDDARWESRNGALHLARSFEKTRCPRFLSPSNKALDTASSPSARVARFPEAPIPSSSRKDGLSDGYGPCSTTSGPRWLMSRCPSSTGAQHGAGTCSVQNNARAHGYKALPEQTDQNHRSVANPSQVFHLLHGKTHGFRGNAHQTDDRRPSRARLKCRPAKTGRNGS